MKVYTMSWEPILFVGMGGFLGANARYFLSLWITERMANATGWEIPFGTAFVNITGSFLLALFLFWAQSKADMVPDSIKLLIGTGFFGAYTTFSTYANESINLFQEDWRTAVGYIVFTNIFCLLGVILGLWLANRLWTV